MGDGKNPPTGQVIVQSGSVVFDAADCGAAAVTEQTVTIPGVAAGDGVILIPPAAGLGVALAIGVGYGSAANTAKVPFINPSAGALNPGSLTYGFRILKPID
jgi:hypothetical protein